MKIIFVSLLLFSISTIAAEDPFAGVTIKAHQITESIYALEGLGGTVGVSVGADGVMMIDSQYQPLSGRLWSAIQALGKGGPDFLVNTHYHGDHVGGNQHFKGGALVMSHDNVRERLAAEDKSGLPDLTYSENANFYFNGDHIHLKFAPAAHTDGDTIVFFKSANVVHMADIFWNGKFPRIDLKAGGTVAGYTNAVVSVLAEIDADTRVIGGHGNPVVADQKALKRFLDMLKHSTAHVQSAIKRGDSIDQVVADGMGQEWASWGTGYINEAAWLKTLYTDLSD